MDRQMYMYIRRLRGVWGRSSYLFQKMGGSLGRAVHLGVTIIVCDKEATVWRDIRWRRSCQRYGKIL